MADRTLNLHVTGLPAFKEVIARITELHQPDEVEAEVWHKAPGRPDGDLDGPCPEPDSRWPSDPCPGHAVTVRVCRECGYEHDGEGPVFRPWPCPTFQALTLLRSTGGEA